MSEENAPQKIDISLDTSPEIYRNIVSPFIVITEDKVNLILKEYSIDLEKKNRWHTPLALFLTIILALLTANFDINYIRFGLNGNTWLACFLIGAIISFCWLVRDVWKAYRTKTDISDIVEKFKAQTNLIKGSNQG